MLSAIYAVGAKAYTKTVYIHKAFQRRTNELVQKHVASSPIAAVNDFVTINEDTIELIKQKYGGGNTKVIKLIESIERTAEEEAGDPFLIAMSDRARAIQENCENRPQSETHHVAEDDRVDRRSRSRKAADISDGDLSRLGQFAVRSGEPLPAILRTVAR